MFRSIAVISRKTIPLAERLAQPFSRRSLFEAAHVMGPTLTALLFMGASSAIAHGQETMDFSGAETLMSTFKTFAAFLHRSKEGTVSRALVETAILLAASQANPAIVSPNPFSLSSLAARWPGPLPKCPPASFTQ